MKFIAKQFSLWRIVLFVGVMAIAIPIAPGFSATVTAIEERQEYPVQQAGANNEDADTKHGEDSKASIGKSVRQDGYYLERRRRQWKNRVENDLDDEDSDEDTDDDRNDSRSARDDDDDDDDEDDTSGGEYDRLERRREYLRQRLDRNW